MTDDEVRAVADEVLRERLGPLGFRRALVRSGFDHHGDPALFIRAHFEPGSGPTGANPLGAALSALHDAFLERGETRFPYLSHYYPDDDFPEDVTPEAAALP